MKKPVKSAASPLGLGAIQRETLNDRVYQQLRTMIMSGRVRPGKELKLRELAKELHVSLMPVRDAIGRLVVERAPVDALFAAPKHPYTAALLASIPGTARRQRLQAIAGTPPSPQQRPPGCVFAPRCAFAEPMCVAARPPEETLADGRTVRCVRHAELDLRAAHV